MGLNLHLCQIGGEIKSSVGISANTEILSEASILKLNNNNWVVSLEVGKLNIDFNKLPTLFEQVRVAQRFSEFAYWYFIYCCLQRRQ